jgi:hypothetical protein
MKCNSQNIRASQRMECNELGPEFSICRLSPRFLWNRHWIRPKSGIVDDRTESKAFTCRLSLVETLLLTAAEQRRALALSLRHTVIILTDQQHNGQQDVYTSSNCLVARQCQRVGLVTSPYREQTRGWLSASIATFYAHIFTLQLYHQGSQPTQRGMMSELDTDVIRTARQTDSSVCAARGKAAVSIWRAVNKFAPN